MNKKYFGSIDSRNIKYQGSIKNGEYDGIGIILDHHFLFAIANWQDESPDGPVFIVFPNRSILYGEIKNKKLNGFCCYQKVSK
jgi:hypothetical protein